MYRLQWRQGVWTFPHLRGSKRALASSRGMRGTDDAAIAPSGGSGVVPARTLCRFNVFRRVAEPAPGGMQMSQQTLRDAGPLRRFRAALAAVDGAPSEASIAT